MYCDAHAHLNDDKLYDGWQWYMDRFVSVGWKALITVGVDHVWNQRALNIVAESKKLYPDTFVGTSLGYHPSEVCFGKITSSADIDTAISQLATLYDGHKQFIVAIGEWGIDTHYPWDPYLDLQKQLFAAQCAFAMRIWLPVVIHSRDDFDSTWEVVQQYPDLVFYFHCWGYTEKELAIVLEARNNIYFGFDGNISYPKAHDLRACLLACPLDKILLETDSPYLAPQQIRWQVNEPAHIVMIYEYVADLLNLSSAILEKTIYTNFMHLFNRW